jgi:hypothetical protein
VDKNLGAAYPLSDITGVKSRFVPLTDEFIFNLEFKIHEVEWGSPRYFRHILISNLISWVQSVEVKISFNISILVFVYYFYATF